jgi:magnesium chelatase family protein
MLAKVHAAAVVGLEGEIVEVEVDTTRGMPSFTIVGLLDTAVQESRERVQAAIKNAGLTFPRHRVTVNLAPADLRKEGPAYDLPIALAALAKQEGMKQMFVPAKDSGEASLVRDLEVIPVRSLTELVNHLSGVVPIPPDEPEMHKTSPEVVALDFQEVRGQEHVKRALEVAAAGGHNLLMAGPPGAGKTLLARALPSILPAMSFDEALDVTRIYSVADQLPVDIALIQTRPFRAPHHTISHAGLVGGGNWPRPGEISLAHRGVLFLDELPEFGRQVLEVMRQPMEDHVVTISRARGSSTFPANFMLIAAMNPCPCGFFGDLERDCRCTPNSVTRYQKRISGPLLDRIDIHVEVPRVDFEKLSSDRVGEPSESVRERVESARGKQRERFVETAMVCNADMGPAEVRKYCRLDETGLALVRQAMSQLQLTARGYHRVLKLARTIADLTGDDEIIPNHLAEALQYRPRRWD